MNYSRTIKNISIGKRILFSWIVIAILFYFLGFGIGSCYNKNTESKAEEVLAFEKSELFARERVVE